MRVHNADSATAGKINGGENPTYSFCPEHIGYVRSKEEWCRL